MTLKDEIEKLVQAEQAKLESQDRKDADYRDRQRKRFVPLRALLEELGRAIDERYLRASIGEDSATLEVGRVEKTHLSGDVRWRIEPNFEIDIFAEKGESNFKEARGFRVEEEMHLSLPESHIAESMLTFESEQDVSEYLATKIAEKIGHYRHLESLLAKRKGRNE